MKPFAVSLSLAFVVSLVSSVYLYPEIVKFLLTDSVAELPVSWLFFLKVFLTLAGQTSILWVIFYTIAKRMF